MFGRQYECVISKVDVRSAFNRTISSHRYQFRSIDLPNNGTLQHVQLKPEVSTVENLSFYDNSLPNVCTRVSPCAVTFRFNLLGPNGKSKVVVYCSEFYLFTILCIWFVYAQLLHQVKRV